MVKAVAGKARVREGGTVKDVGGEAREEGEAQDEGGAGNDISKADIAVGEIGRNNVLGRAGINGSPANGPMRTPRGSHGKARSRGDRSSSS